MGSEKWPKFQFRVTTPQKDAENWFWGQIFVPILVFLDFPIFDPEKLYYRPIKWVLKNDPNFSFGPLALEKWSNPLLRSKFCTNYSFFGFPIKFWPRKVLLWANQMDSEKWPRFQFLATPSIWYLEPCLKTNNNLPEWIDQFTSTMQ